MQTLQRINKEKDYYKDNFSPEEQQMHVNYTVDAINELLTDFENRFVTGNDNHLYKLAMINDFKDYLENAILKM